LALLLLELLARVFSFFRLRMTSHTPARAIIPTNATPPTTPPTMGPTFDLLPPSSLLLSFLSPLGAVGTGLLEVSFEDVGPVVVCSSEVVVTGPGSESRICCPAQLSVSHTKRLKTWFGVAVVAHRYVTHDGCSDSAVLVPG
jgi:hypothetical protein